MVEFTLDVRHDLRIKCERGALVLHKAVLLRLSKALLTQ